MALRHLLRAASLEAGGAGADEPSPATLLNMAACCSSLGRHAEAVGHAERAVRAAAARLQVRAGKLPALPLPDCRHG